MVLLNGLPTLASSIGIEKAINIILSLLLISNCKRNAINVLLAFIFKNVLVLCTKYVSTRVYSYCVNDACKALQGVRLTWNIPQRRHIGCHFFPPASFSSAAYTDLSHRGHFSCWAGVKGIPAKSWIIFFEETQICV